MAYDIVEQVVRMPYLVQVVVFLHLDYATALRLVWAQDQALRLCARQRVWQRVLVDSRMGKPDRLAVSTLQFALWLHQRFVPPHRVHSLECRLSASETAQLCVSGAAPPPVLGLLVSLSLALTTIDVGFSDLGRVLSLLHLVPSLRRLAILEDTDSVLYWDILASMRLPSGLLELNIEQPVPMSLALRRLAIPSSVVSLSLRTGVSAPDQLPPLPRGLATLTLLDTRINDFSPFVAGLPRQLKVLRVYRSALGGIAPATISQEARLGFPPLIRSHTLAVLPEGTASLAGVSFKYDRWFVDLDRVGEHSSSVLPPVRTLTLSGLDWTAIRAFTPPLLLHDLEMNTSTGIPQAVALLPGLKSLVLTYCSLGDLPAILPHMKTLCRLTLSNVSLLRPIDLLLVPKLQELAVEYADSLVTKLGLDQCSQLTRLDLWNNRILTDCLLVPAKLVSLEPGLSVVHTPALLYLRPGKTWGLVRRYLSRAPLLDPSSLSILALVVPVKTEPAHASLIPSSVECLRLYLTVGHPVLNLEHLSRLVEVSVRFSDGGSLPECRFPSSVRKLLIRSSLDVLLRLVLPPALEELDLMYCQVGSPWNGSLPETLRVLVLLCNRYLQPPPPLYLLPRSLEELHLNYCGLTTLGGWKFPPSLTKLDLRTNKLELLEETFAALQGLPVGLGTVLLPFTLKEVGEEVQWPPRCSVVLKTSSLEEDAPLVDRFVRRYPEGRVWLQ